MNRIRGEYFMEELANRFLAKLYSYNIFNYLFPGVIYSFFLSFFLGIDYLDYNLLVLLFVFYFIGMIISRIGSLVIEPVLIKFKMLKRREYRDFAKAEMKDKKIALLSEQSNTYRTLAALFLVILISFIIASVSGFRSFCWFYYVSACLGLILFSCAFVKQNDYINKRIDICKKEED